MDIEGRYLGSSLTVAYKSYRRGKKRRDKGDSGELYNMQHTAYPVWETFTFLSSCASRFGYTLAPTQSSLKSYASARPLQPPEELLDRNLFN